MGNLKTYETFCRGNINENEIIKIKIFTDEFISENEIEQINNMRLCDVQGMRKIRGWQVFVINN